MILISQIVEGILMTYRDSSTCLVDMHLRTSDIQELLRDYPELAAGDFGWGTPPAAAFAVYIQGIADSSKHLSRQIRSELPAETLKWIEDTARQVSEYDRWSLVDQAGYARFVSTDIHAWAEAVKELVKETTGSFGPP